MAEVGRRALLPNEFKVCLSQQHANTIVFSDPSPGSFWFAGMSVAFCALLFAGRAGRAGNLFMSPCDPEGGVIRF